MIEIIFKVADKANIDTLIKLMSEYYAYDRIPFDESVAREALGAVIKDKALGHVWLIQLEGKTVGYMALMLGYSLEYGRDAFLDEIYIQERYRGQGVGREAIRFLEKKCRSLGVNVLHLEVERENSRAQNLYRKVGFEDHDRYLLTKWISKAEE